ncbi:hypothetical protein [Cetobacterium sp.]|uniref:hypothetical protein n=1 Tax=Cetobacterium sp. TaxID=2071632 RepID=UPI003F32A771
MRKFFSKFLDIFFKLMTICYPIYLILGIILLPIIFIFGGFSGVKESYFDKKDLSYKVYLDWNKYFWKRKS